ncbi:sensor histidine kinase [Streptomyces sp. TLI_171]|uniref:sensor histidine kinase n=1 Tax=Streptomyces sp. TLI_171 TaxID=1938859 RepID=UPI000C67CF46|nr:histidine kinase [Streptomyces sp. TLI_171]RKE21536.1 signal transduction histidine kinase [Streptomyces sp. TLI_171]
MSTLERWTRWPAGDVPIRERSSRARIVLSLFGRIAMLSAVLFGTFAEHRYSGWRLLPPIGWIAAAAGLFTGWFLSCRAQRLWPALGCAAGLLVVAGLAHEGGADTLASVVWCGLAVLAVIRLPLAAGLLTAGAALASYGLGSGDSLLVMLAVAGGIGLLGYLLRLDSQARSAQRALLAQERAAQAAQAESAALAERARIAREIHDVLAHSLSAQLVHLEAARLMLDAGAERAEVRERIVAARRMAQDGLSETRQALSALRGEFAPVAEFVAELAAQSGAELTVDGVPRPLPAEPGLAVRRTAQEALTNARKHAPGGRVAVRLAYLEGSVELTVRNSGAPRGADPMLGDSGSGYGLLGMRERAELLGGELLAGPEDGGWRVLLRVPA